VATKRTGPFAVVVGSQAAGACALVLLALAIGEVLPAPRNLIWCAVGGLAGAVGLLSLYRALAIGRMGVAAPVSGVLSAGLPVAAGAILEGAPGPLTLIGFALALVAVWLIAHTEGTVVRFDQLGLPVLAGVGFGLFIVVIGRQSGGAVFWPLVAARVASLLALTTIARTTRQPAWPNTSRLPVVVLAGLFDAAGNAFLVMAAQAGRLDVAAVLSSLYPAGTVLLAWWLLRERLTRWQCAGLAASLIAIALITAPRP
jgi:uncharacterized membrane protein